MGVWGCGSGLASRFIRSRRTEESENGGVGERRSRRTEESENGGIGERRNRRTEESENGGIGERRNRRTEESENGGVGERRSRRTEESENGGVEEGRKPAHTPVDYCRNAARRAATPRCVSLIPRPRGRYGARPCHVFKPETPTRPHPQTPTPSPFAVHIASGPQAFLASPTPRILVS